MIPDTRKSWISQPAIVAQTSSLKVFEFSWRITARGCCELCCRIFEPRRVRPLAGAKILNARNPGRSAALGFILVNVFLDALSFGLIFPIVPKR